MILQTGEEINELDSSGFFTSGPTVFAGIEKGVKEKEEIAYFKNVLF